MPHKVAGSALLYSVVSLMVITLATLALMRSVQERQVDYDHLRVQQEVALKAAFKQWQAQHRNSSEGGQ